MKMYKKFCFIVASVFGVGFIPFASGTFGSAVTLPMVYFFGSWQVALVSMILGCVVTKEVLKHTKHDPSLVVIDEVTGQSLTFVFVMPYLHIWWVWLLGFALFRLFDICKFGPVKYFDTKVENAFGVMMDDVIAGLFAGVILKICIMGYYL